MTKIRFRDITNLLIYHVERHPFVIQTYPGRIGASTQPVVVEHSHAGQGPKDYSLQGVPSPRCLRCNPSFQGGRRVSPSLKTPESPCACARSLSGWMLSLWISAPPTDQREKTLAWLQLLKMMQQTHATMSGFAVVRLFSDHGLHRWGDLGNPSLELSFTCYLLAPALLDLLLTFRLCW